MIGSGEKIRELRRRRGCTPCPLLRNVRADAGSLPEQGPFRHDLPETRPRRCVSEREWVKAEMQADPRRKKLGDKDESVKAPPCDADSPDPPGPAKAPRRRMQKRL